MSHTQQILVVDDDRGARRILSRVLERAGFSVDTASSGARALEAMQQQHYDLLISDLYMPDMTGVQVVEQVRKSHPDTIPVIVTGHGSMDTAIEALRVGAQDYLLKPLVTQDVVRRTRMLLEHRELATQVSVLRHQYDDRMHIEGMVQDAPAMRVLMEEVRKIAPSKSNVLIEGESGTGKEVIARAIHEWSDVRDRVFIPVNLSAQPPDLIDATMFGHERGAFTGAHKRRDGVFRACQGGTVFLDEISELPARVQVKLLRVLENREVLPIGADAPIPVRFRLLAATNKRLSERVEQGKFRQDLYYRLNVVYLEVPPLRDRPEDIPLLAATLLRRHAKDMGRPVPDIAPETLSRLIAHDWPGNVRELSNALERALLLAGERTIEPDALPPQIGGKPHAPPTTLKAAVDDFERRYILDALRAAGGDRAAAAQQLGVHVATLYRRIAKLGIP